MFLVDGTDDMVIEVLVKMVSSCSKEILSLQGLEVVMYLKREIVPDILANSFKDLF